MATFSEFVLSAASPKQFVTDNLPEIALVGRSNVGKSSMLNSLLRQSKLARTSNTPGRTQTLNFYRVWPDGKPKLGDPADPHDPDRFSLKGAALEAAQQSGAFYFVDMPGYGFAKVSKSTQEQWRKLIEHYLLTRPNLKAVIQMVDLRHPPSRDDVGMHEWLRHHGKVRLTVATKADKIGRTHRPKHLKEMAQGLGMRGMVAPTPETLGPEHEPILVYSSEENVGREELWNWIMAIKNT